MHPNPAFRKAEAEQNLAFARTRAFGALIVAGEEVMLSHVPFLLAETGESLDLHLVRSNPMARAVRGATPATLAVTGPDGYVSPDWYGVADQVPTWNYVAVHLKGTLSPLPPEEMRGLLERQSAAYEARLGPKAPWTLGKMTPEVLERMLRQILPFRMTVEAVEGTWKLGQNKADGVRRAAAEQVAGGFGSDLAALAALMSDPPA